MWFVRALREVGTEWPIDLWAWVIMPEHVHLLVAPREAGVPVGEFQGAIKVKVARQAISWLEQHSPAWLSRITVKEGQQTRRRFWQPGGGHDRNIDKLKTLLKVIEYIHLNPVRCGLVEKAIDWEWSSAGWFAWIRPVLIEMDPTLPMIHPSGTPQFFTLGGTP
jgi:putative transposase